jgi:hypothetical protein
MNETMSERMRVVIVSLFAVAMAWVESAVVVYLRTMVGRIDPYQTDPLPMSGAMAALGRIEMGREAATLVMLLSVGLLAGRSVRARWAYTLLAFGVWDIFYYVWLELMTGWPHSLLSWDILFLLPLPWWGPVLAPVAISLVLIAGSVQFIRLDSAQARVTTNKLTWLMAGLGVLLALYVFMSNALSNMVGGIEAIRTVLPVVFNWPLFGIALLLMVAPVAELALLERRRQIHVETVA